MEQEHTTTVPQFCPHCASTDIQGLQERVTTAYGHYREVIQCARCGESATFAAAVSPDEDADCAAARAAWLAPWQVAPRHPGLLRLTRFFLPPRHAVTEWHGKKAI